MAYVRKKKDPAETAKTTVTIVLAAMGGLTAGYYIIKPLYEHNAPEGSLLGAVLCVGGVIFFTIVIYYFIQLFRGRI